MNKCPKCTSEMTTKHFGPLVSVDRCTNCFGFWITAAALRKMTQLPMSDVLDVGSVEVGARYNAINEIDCPVCSEAMQHEFHPIQRHIRYEHCIGCDGYFLDAGEFTDIKHYTVGDWFKSLLLPRSR